MGVKIGDMLFGDSKVTLSDCELTLENCRVTYKGLDSNKPNAGKVALYNPRYANQSITTSYGILEFDSDGKCIVDFKVGCALSELKGFYMVDESEQRCKYEETQ